MKKNLPILIIAAGLVLIGYGVWKVMDTSKKTEQTLEAAKLAIGHPQKADRDRFKPKFGEAAGILEIPKIHAELPIVEGTDADDLEKGVGHYKGSYYPNDNGQIVLSGHRDTVFRRTGELKRGDRLKILLPYGSFSYKIEKTKIVDKNDTSIITLQHDKEELILTTCYPFSYIGNAPKRYIIYGKRV
ncbi:class D sortase [Bacillus paralicheniformis]|uniref:class D sortase n=1 Tax=Bacillus paralicheniformis TaxID=1648923 RepID=UPI0011A942D0|nr:class D sortase [Bacillus paralicheniformis]MCJ8221964.1 class D sortase [Bacillus paralicheniformis]MCY8149925.1 class D sortase [Bacillus paralicheniformis]MCY9419443.1 class D sortase [Bacillus paralicheniformis]MDW6055998.1 class D sortase [Bacillus paralicheniformis]MEC0577863.1 class D sortase [Bacillus paralicheniformis]